MTKTIFFIIFSLSIFSFFLPSLISAADSPQKYLFSAGSKEQYENPAQMVQKVYKIGMGVAGASALGVIIFGAVIMLLSGGNASKRQEGMEWIKAASYGLLLLLGSYIILRTINPDLIDIGKTQERMDTSMSAMGVPGGGSPPGENNNKGAGYVSYSSNRTYDPDISKKYNSQIQKAATETGLSSKEIAAIIQIESSGNPGAVNTTQTVDGKTITSYGLMQITVSTARAYDLGLSGLSNDQIIGKLRDPDYNVSLGSKIFSSLQNKWGSAENAIAAYNGGGKANEPSVNCQGLSRWQCAYDNNENTVANKGYAVTRKYVADYNSIIKSYR